MTAASAFASVTSPPADRRRWDRNRSSSKSRQARVQRVVNGVVASYVHELSVRAHKAPVRVSPLEDARAPV